MRNRQLNRSLIFMSLLIFTFVIGCNSFSKKKSIADLPEPAFDNSKEDSPPPPPLPKDIGLSKIREEVDRIEGKYMYTSFVYSLRAIDFYKRKDLQSALAYFDTAIAFYPYDSTAFYNRGLIKFRLNDKVGGCLDMKKSLRLGSTKAQEIIENYCSD